MLQFLHPDSAPSGHSAKMLARLLILLFLMAMVPKDAPAQNVYLHFWDVSNSTHETGSLPYSDGKWTYTFSWADIVSMFGSEPNVSAGYLYVLPKVDYSGTYIYYANSWVAYETSGSSAYFGAPEKNNYYDSRQNAGFKLPDNKENYVYTITVDDFNSSAYTCRMTISWAEKHYFTLTYGNTNLTSTSTDGNYTFTIPQSAYSSTGGLSFKVGEATSSNAAIQTYYGLSGSSTQAINGSYSATLSSGNETVFSLAANLGNEAPAGNITVTLNSSTGAFTVSYTTVQDENNSAYYVVSPQLSGGKCIKTLRMQEARNRVWVDKSLQGDGKPNTSYWNLNLKDDDLRNFVDNSLIADGTQIQWWIQNGAGTEFYYPTTDNFPLGFETSDNKGEAIGANAHYGKLEDQARSELGSATDNLYYAFTKGADKSYTFMLDKYYDANEYSTKSNVMLVHNGSIVEGSGEAAQGNNFNVGDGYYLIGNYSNTRTGYVTLDPSSGSFRKLMTKYYYSKGTAYTESQTKNDSIVYRASLTKPDNGWGNLYLMIAPKGLIDKWSTLDNESYRWLWMIRPQVASQKFDSFDTKNGFTLDVDSRCYQGGLYQGNTDMAVWTNNAITGDNMNQAINPDLTELLSSLGVTDIDDISSYDFSFNVTTSTYRLVFNKEIGPSGDSKLVLRDYGDVKYNGSTRAVKGRTAGTTNYRFFRTYHASVAYTCPDAVDRFVVTDITRDATTQLTTITVKKIADTDYTISLNGTTTKYLPDHTAMILASAMADDATLTDVAGTVTYDKRDANTGLNSHSGTFTEAQYSVSKISSSTDEANKYTYKGIVSDYFVGTNEAMPLTQSYPYTDPTDGSAQTGYNYLFSFYRHSKWSSDGKDKDANENDIFDLGFWVSNGNNSIYENSAYLHLPADLINKNYIGTSYDMGDVKTSAKKVPAVFLKWDLGDDTVTGITDIRGNTAQQDDAWYTVQGVRMAKPAQHGVYIHNGKKVIVK